jgi:hypothetical protein
VYPTSTAAKELDQRTSPALDSTCAKARSSAADHGSQSALRAAAGIAPPVGLERHRAQDDDGGGRPALGHLPGTAPRPGPRTAGSCADVARHSQTQPGCHKVAGSPPRDRTTPPRRTGHDARSWTSPRKSRQQPEPWGREGMLTRAPRRACMCRNPQWVVKPVP